MHVSNPSTTQHLPTGDTHYSGVFVFFNQGHLTLALTQWLGNTQIDAKHRYMYCSNIPGNCERDLLPPQRTKLFWFAPKKAAGASRASGRLRLHAPEYIDCLIVMVATDSSIEDLNIETCRILFKRQPNINIYYLLKARFPLRGLSVSPY